MGHFEGKQLMSATIDENCEAGCMVFSGGERRHHKDCVHYPESLTKYYEEVAAENERLRVALHEAITRPMGVVPDAALEFYDPKHLSFGLTGAEGSRRPPRLEGAGPFPASWWSPQDGAVMWWLWDAERDTWDSTPPYIGTPNDRGYSIEAKSRDTHPETVRMSIGGWPALHTHWTRISRPPAPKASSPKSED
jgi:hypothetical protein